MSVPADVLKSYNEEHEKILGEFMSAYAASDWTKSKEDSGVTISTRSFPGSSFTMSKGEIIINHPLSAVNEKLKTLPKIENAEGFVQRYTFNDIGDDHGSCFVYAAIESGSSMVTNRDFLMYRRHYTKDGKEIYLHHSVENESLKPEDKNFVRGFMTMQGYVAEPSGSGTKLTFIVHADPKGSIPAMVYNAVSSKNCMAVKRIADSI